jgi:hypothetical protein
MIEKMKKSKIYHTRISKQERQTNKLGDSVSKRAEKK